MKSKQEQEIIRANHIHHQFIRACENGNIEFLRKNQKCQHVLKQLYKLNTRSVYPTIEEKYGITVYAVPFIAALKGWNNHPTTNSLETLNKLMTKKIKPDFPIIKIVLDYRFFPRFKPGNQDNDTASCTFTLADFIRYNKNYLNNQKCPSLLKPFYTDRETLGKIIDRMHKGAPKGVRIAVGMLSASQKSNQKILYHSR